MSDVAAVVVWHPPILLLLLSSLSAFCDRPPSRRRVQRSSINQSLKLTRETVKKLTQ